MELISFQKQTKHWNNRYVSIGERKATGGPEGKERNSIEKLHVKGIYEKKNGQKSVAIALCPNSLWPRKSLHCADFMENN